MVLTLRAIARARRTFEACRDRPLGRGPEAEAASRDARHHAVAALEHLDAGRWDEAVDLAARTAELDELHGRGSVWREFTLLVEEAAETGRGA